MDAVEKIHQTTAEIPIEILKEMGYPEDKAELFKDSHRRVLRTVYGGICNAHKDLGTLVVQQFGELGKFANGVVESGGSTSNKARQTKVRSKASQKKVTTGEIDTSVAKESGKNETVNISV
jgi:hypothetical protein